MRVNASRRKLMRVWRQLDNACGELYNAKDNASVLPEDIRDKLERIDVTQIVAVKEQVEILLDKMRDKK